MEKITVKWLEQKNACKEGIKWWKNKGRNPDGIETLHDLINDSLLNWANWLIVRLMNHDQQIQVQGNTNEANSH